LAWLSPAFFRFFRLVNRVKRLLISEMKTAETVAPHYIEKYAMDNSLSQREAARHLLKTDS